MNYQVVVEYRALRALVPYKRKLRKHDHAVQKRMAALIKEFGFKIPVLIRGSGEIVDGHLRVKAAVTLGMTEVPVIVCDEWTEAQVQGFRLAVNRSASWAEWDMGLVAMEMGELKVLGFDLSLSGFEPIEIRGCFPNDGTPGESESAKADVPVTRVGDLWICGDHRVVCGDATLSEVVTRLLNGAVPVLMVTDPPYGVEYDPLWREHADLGKQRQIGRVMNDDRVDWRDAYKLFPGEEATGHGTQKPEELMQRAIVNSSRLGEAVYDPFLGSGTTLAAAENNGRVCFGIDLDPTYVDHAVVRWQKLTGKQAVLEGDGRSFDEIALERRTVQMGNEDAAA
jgi:hypothetical protein